ncbi:MAG: rhombosortase [Woeseia sp.]
MGLGQDRNRSSFTIPRRVSLWQLPAVLIASSGILELFGDPGRAGLRLDRAAILDGEIWRLLSGHFVHLGISHYILNGLGLILVWLLVGMHFELRQWLLVIVVSIAGVDAGLLYFDHELVWYVGMSGLLHAMLAAGIVGGLKAAPREMVIVAIVILAKITVEQLVGPLPGSEESAGGEVVVNAHLYGVLAGAIAAAAIIRGHFKRHKNGE